MEEEKKKILIVGAGVAGRELLGQIRKGLKSVYEIVGFADDDPKKLGKKIGGIKVLGAVNALPWIIRKNKVDEVFIAIPSGEGKTIRKVVDKCRKIRVNFKIIPRLLEIVEGKVKLQQVREVKVEDVLGRAILKSKQTVFKDGFRGKRILVTGAAGSIGSEICRQLVSFRPELVVALDWSENGLYDLELELGEKGAKIKYIVANASDYPKMAKTVSYYKPDVVFHAAAYKHVPLMQIFPEEAVRNNIFATEVVARVVKENKVKKFVLLSTDKAVDPTSVMGATKLIAEKIIRSHNGGATKFCAVRFGNVFGSVGSVVPTFKKQIARGGPLTVTDKRMVRFFMSIPEAVRLVLHASLLAKGGEIFVLDMGDQFKIDELARLMIRLAGFVPDKEIKIKYVGVRPGEKMSEELFSKKDKIAKTSVERIFKVKNGREKGISDHDLEALRAAVAEGKRKRVFGILKSFAPNLKNLESI
ncbi:MAG: Polysaccharide biosynthesis protein CapD [Candidatus Woesebacteria bacterium GW2011_GWB1_45_5]|uniref:Polysaccharide biosynthesis protein CapD n=1 Tax=Candidatus Woesebacteria bacterium GW2011_GWB1_45_5 TaxID=1618581 RepID=A0A0G1MRZ4_9BACT|nr:MAG: Polysaccharide biosynthesis protein CapD [Candidatus Woesebacteria bacterium GW2011_GWB1_45_5]